MLKKTLKNFFIDPISIIIIPDSSKKTKQFKLIKGLVVIPFLLFVITFSYISYENVHLRVLNKDLSNVLTVKSDSIHSLNLVIKRQGDELTELESTTEVVKNKLLQLGELESRVRSLVGLQQSAEIEGDVALSTGVLATESFDPTNEDLANLLSKEYEQYDDFISTLEKQLNIMEAKPDAWPVKGKISSKFGYRIHPISQKKQFHKGIDIVNKLNTDVKAAGSGIITFSGWNSGYGNVVKIAHGYGYQSVYAHNNKLLVKVGDKVKKGDVIAKLGSTGQSTGPHVHFEVHYQGQQIDPEEVLKSE